MAGLGKHIGLRQGSPAWLIKARFGEEKGSDEVRQRRRGMRLQKRLDGRRFQDE